MQRDGDITTVTLQELAAIFACDESTVKQYLSRGHVVRVKRGQYALLESVTKTIVYLRGQAARMNTRDGKIDAVEESALLKRANRMMVEMDMRKQAGELIEIAELQEVWSEVLRAVRSMVLAWPSRCAFEMPHLTAQDRATMQRIADETLRNNSLANPMMGPLPDKRTAA